MLESAERQTARLTSRCISPVTPTSDGFLYQSQVANLCDAAGFWKLVDNAGLWPRLHLQELGPGAAEFPGYGMGSQGPVT